MIRSSDFKSVKYGIQVINTIKYGTKTVWTLITDIISCFASGYWINDKRWTNEKGWKN